MSTFTYHRPGIGNASSYIVSGTPWYTSSLAPALSTTSTVINLPRVTNSITIKNTSTTGDVLRFTLNDDNIVDNTNYITLEDGESFSAELRVVDVQLISDSETPVPFTILAGLTNIDRKEMYGKVPSAPNLLAWVQKQKLIANDPDGSPEGDYFARSIVSFVNGGVNNLLIGSQRDEGPNGEYRAGSIYRFAEIDGRYQQIEKLPYPPEIIDPVNKRVGLFDGSNQDGTKIVFRKFLDSNSAYIYQSGSSGYQIVQEIANPDPGSLFITNCHFSGDDSILLLSSGFDDSFGLSSAGAIRVYQSSSVGYQYKQIITASYNTDGSPDGLTAFDFFGDASAISLDGQKIFAGSNSDDEAASGAGAVYIFQSSSVGYQQVQKITASYNTDGTPESWKAGASFGHSLAISTDSNLLIVGARFNDEKDPDNGAVYVFVSGSSGYEQVQKITASFDTKGIPETGLPQQNFGESVSLSSDNSVLSVYAAEDQEDGGGGLFQGSGAVYIFHSGSEGYYQVKKITGSINTDGTPEVPTPSERFGSVQKLSSDGKTLLVGTAWNDENGENAGAAYIFKYTRDY